MPRAPIRRPPKVVRATRTDLRQPQRTCVGCRKIRPRTELYRCVISAEGRAVVDASAHGRGAWICGPQCLDAAIGRRGFDRAWRVTAPATIDEDLRGGLERLMASKTHGDDPKSQDTGAENLGVGSRATMLMRAKG